MSNPIAVCFHDPLGMFTVPATDVAPSMPGLCSRTFEQKWVTLLYPDGTETEVNDRDYCALVTEGKTGAWFDDRPSCPYLTALTKLPWFPKTRYTYEDLAHRWSTAAALPQHRGTPGVRSEFDLTYVESFGPFESEWGVSYRHEFLDQKDKFVWWTGKELDIIPSETRRVKATVKKHEFFKGSPVTELTRVSPIKGERKLTKEPETHEPSV
jgi:hypothetical protein